MEVHDRAACGFARSRKRPTIAVRSGGARMPQPVGVSIPLSLPRQLICDYLHFARQIPSVPVQRRMRLGEVVAARAATGLRPSWCAIFTKAYGFVTAAQPQFRRAYLPFPRPRFYEHPV